MSTFVEALKHRRSYYALSNQSIIDDEEIIGIMKTALRFIPSANNAQTTRIVLLLGEHHQKLWDIVRQTLKVRTSPEQFEKTNAKINKSFASGYGTVLFFEDQKAMRELQQQFPSYADNYPTWGQHTNAMHQLTVWTMLEDRHFGASLQHYNPIIDDEVRATWNLPQDWQLIAQMPFGIPVEPPRDKSKEEKPMEDRFMLFK